LGSTAEAAIAAAAPHTPVAQPVSRPKSRVSPNRRAAQAPNTMVQETAASAISTGSAPPSTSCPEGQPRAEEGNADAQQGAAGELDAGLQDRPRRQRL
jgi:hypothetical protein